MDDKNSRQINYHCSGIRKYYECPHKFNLSRKHEIEKDSKALTMGLLFEGYLLGFKSDNPEDEYSEFQIRGMELKEDGTPKGNKGMKDATVLPIKTRAEYFKKWFADGASFVKLEYDGDYNDAEALRGEADFIGNVWIRDEIYPGPADPEQGVEFEDGWRYSKRPVICDVKDTSDIYWRWRINSEQQVLQAIIYPYLWYKMTGEILDFCYFIIWNKSDTIFKQLYFKTTEETFKRAEEILNKIDNDIIKSPNISWETCGKGEFNAPCDYIEYCEAGREFIAESQWIDWDGIKEGRPITGDDIDKVFNDLEAEND